MDRDATRGIESDDTEKLATLRKAENITIAKFVMEILSVVLTYARVF